MSENGAKAGGLSTFEEIHRRIVEGIYRPGERLVEQRLAEDLNSSRTPVREAIRRLQETGLVVSIRNRGAVVRRLSRADIMDLYALRSRLEAFAAELAAERVTPEDLQVLTDAVDEFDTAVRCAELNRESVRLINAANRTFHSGVLTAARHTTLSQSLSKTVDAALVFGSFQQFSRSELENSASFHRLILRAIETRQPDRAGWLMREHILQGRDVLLRGLDGTHGV